MSTILHDKEYTVCEECQLACSENIHSSRVHHRIVMISPVLASLSRIFCTSDVGRHLVALQTSCFAGAEFPSVSLLV